MAITTINAWMLNHLTWSDPVRLMLAQAWSGMLVVCALAYVAGVLPKQHNVETAAYEKRRWLANSMKPAWIIAEHCNPSNQTDADLKEQS